MKEVLDGKMTHMQAIQRVAKLWDHDGNGVVVFEEFVEYYKDLGKVFLHLTRSASLIGPITLTAYSYKLRSTPVLNTQD